MRAFKQTGAGPALLTGPETTFAPHLEEAPLLSMGQILSILRARRKIVLLLTAALIAISLTVIKLLPHSYEATTTMIVSFQLKQGEAEADMPVGMLGTYMATQIDLMQSPEVLLPVVDQLDLTHDREFSSGYSGSDSDTAAIRHYAMTVLAKHVTILQGTGSQLLYVTAASENPVKAAKLANAIADEYSSEERQRLKDPADVRAQNYSAQLAELKDKVMAAQQKVTELRQQTGVLSLANQDAPGVNDPDTQTLIGMEQQLLVAQNTRRLAESAAIMAPGLDAAEGGVVPPQIHDLTAEINAKTLQLSELSTTYGARHPKVVALQTELDQARQSLRREAARFLEQSRKAEDQLQHSVDAQRQKMLSVRKVQDQASKLELELESAQSVYKRALDGYDQIVFASLGNPTNVGFVSRATTPVEAANSNKIKLLVIAMLLAVVIGVGGPLSYELFADRRLYCRDDVERHFGIPVLAEFGVKSLPNLVGSK
jgi:succinoglycan biosynthesis transport protein ExoP